MPAVVIAGTHSGVGKTTISVALIAALRRRGLRVQAFKSGPDFIDAAHLTAISGVPCRHLDGWMLSQSCNEQRFKRALGESDFVLIEGVMGLFDGADAVLETGSTAEMAKWLDVPVLLVADAAGMARSVAALALGFKQFDPDLKLGGIILNRIGGPGHTRYLRDALQLVQLPLLGSCPNQSALNIPERHLGLHMPAATTASDSTGDLHAELATFAEQHLDLPAILELSAKAPWAPTAPVAQSAVRTRARIGVASDEAFCFYYPENLELLANTGAELVPFSPLSDENLPAGLDGIYIGGGYPEVYAPQLSANTSMRAEIRRFAESGGFIYAECGGLMYLSRSIEDTEGQRHPMAGILPCSVRMCPHLRALGYREVTPVGLGGGDELRCRGHEFHYSEIVECDYSGPSAHRVARANGSGETEGFLLGSVFASYIHLHFASNPRLAAAIVATCENGRRQPEGA